MRLKCLMSVLLLAGCAADADGRRTELGSGPGVVPAGTGQGGVGVAGDPVLPGSVGAGGSEIGGDPNAAVAGPGVVGASVSGTVWAPGNAPGMVPAGEEIPVFNALVRLLYSRPDAIPEGAYCEQCIEVEGAYARTGHDGSFSVNGIDPGTVWLVVEKGQFRVARQITLAPGESSALGQEYTTLPSVHDSASGDWVPRIAVATGSSDHIEDVLGKLGIGGVDGQGTYTPGPGDSRIDFYGNGGRGDALGGLPPALSGLFPANPGGGGDIPIVGSFSDLLGNPAQMQQYHIIFVPCSTTDNSSLLGNQQVLRNIRDYVAMGGKLYVTDWSGEVHDNVFPEQVELGGGQDTPASAYNRAADTWNSSLFGAADGSSYDSENAEVIDPDLYDWLNGQSGPTPYGGSGPFNPANLQIVDNWNTITNLRDVVVGKDSEGADVVDSPYPYVQGGQGSSTPKLPLTVTYEPAGCGRVLYSTYHTTETSHTGLVPQERILLYLIMEIGVCKVGPIVIY